MSVTVRLYKGMTKDISSTKVPALGNYTSYTDYTCEFYEPFSLTDPRVILTLSISEDLSKINYAYISTFGRYYWVTGIEYMDGRWLISLSVDVLATYKTQIGSSSQYVVRSASARDGDITDNAYPLTGNIITSAKTNDGWTAPFKNELKDGMFIVGIVGESNSGSVSFGAVNYYGFTLANFGSFISALMANTGDWLKTADTTINDLKSNTLKTILNPMQYITTCAWFPLSYTYGTDSTADIDFGWWAISGITHKKLSTTTDGTPVISGTLGFNTSSTRHPQASARGNYLNRDPYAEYTLYIPQLGNITIPSDIYAKSNYINVDYFVDFPTGYATFDIEGRANADGTGTKYFITRTSARISVDVPIAQIAIDTVGAAQSGVGTIGGAISNGIVGNIVGLITGLVQGGIDTAVKATQPIPNIMATAGSISTCQYAPRIVAKFRYVADAANDLIGSPYCRKVSINTLSGFVLCATKHIQIPGATRPEIEAVEEYLTSGFHYE